VKWVRLSCSVASHVPAVGEHGIEDHDRLMPQFVKIYASQCWNMIPAIDRVVVNDRARADLGLAPKYDVAHALA
jgi:UDP-glucose 4-epimerase